MRKLRLTAVKELALCGTAKEWESQDAQDFLLSSLGLAVLKTTATKICWLCCWEFASWPQEKGPKQRGGKSHDLHLPCS
jgi:hypothetical protein